MERRPCNAASTRHPNAGSVDGRFRVLIAGGGVAALEAVLALREAVGDRAGITLLAPNPDLRYRPLAAVEPFGMGEVEVVPLAQLASDLDLTIVHDLLDTVDTDQRVVTTASGEELPYDGLLIATGARAEPALFGAVTYRGPESASEIESLLAAAENGEVSRLAFAVPPLARWSLPLYELAVLTARHLRRRGAATEIALATAEEQPLELFGPEPSEGVRQLLAIEGIDLQACAAPVAVRDGELRLANGGGIAADAVVALPRFAAPPIHGIPQGPGGFIATDPLMRVEGLDRVWAVGDVTWFPIKQGGLAAQQADAAATSIASAVDPEVEPSPFEPVLRGALMTGWTPYYLRSAIGGSAPSDGSNAPLWWPPSKVAGRLLAPYLADFGQAESRQRRLEDLEAASEREADHLDALELALTSADLDARGSDYAGALRWLEAAERLNLTLPTDYAMKRQRWEAELLAAQPDPA